MSNKTNEQYLQATARCREIFRQKNDDYGTSWRVLRLGSIADQLYIKARRIRTIEEKGTSAVNEGIEPEFMGIVNYCVMGLIQLELPSEKELPAEDLLVIYDRIISQTQSLMGDKNSDYDEAWRHMRVSTFTDMLLVRLERINQMIENKGQSNQSEGIDANLMDMINYSIFALIRIAEGTA